MGKLVWVFALVWATAWQNDYFAQAHSGNSERFKPQDDVGGKPNCSDVLLEKMMRGDVPSFEVALFVGILPVFCILGLAGGIISLIGLVKKDMQVPANKFLLGMTIGDIILVTSGFVHFVARLMDWDLTCREKPVAYALKTAAYMSVIGGRVITLFITILGFERVLSIWLPSISSKLPFSKYPLAILAAGTGVCIFFTSSLFELAVGAITPYHTNATTFILLGPSFGGDRPARTSGMVAISIVHHLLVIANIILVIAALVRVIQKKRNGDSDDEDDQKQLTLTTTYIAIGGIFCILMIPGLICSLMANADPEFGFYGKKKDSFKAFLFIHYLMEMAIPLLHLPVLVTLHVYLRDSLGATFGCVKDEEARRLVPKNEDDEH